ncbi:MAG: hypothetical protein Kow00122_12530 [Thermoleophilia bacterium]
MTADATLHDERPRRRNVDPGRVSPAQRFLDALIVRGFLWAVPRWLRPNHVTAVRLLLTPLVFLLFRRGAGVAAVVLFGVAAATDFIDGAMARTRGQITGLGTMIDPVADKLLVAAALLAVGLEYLVVKVILALMAVEMVVVAVGTAFWLQTGKAVGANVFGKVKMVLLSVGLTLFLAGRVAKLDRMTAVAVVLLWLALVFAFLAGVRLLRAAPGLAGEAPEPTEAARGSAREVRGSD